MGGFIDTAVKIGTLGLVETDFAGEQAQEAALEGAAIQAQAGREALVSTEEARERAQTFFEPFAGAAERGVEASQFLADPQAQFDFLQDNPLFQLALENANQRTLQGASANRRLSFGDTLQELSNNVLLSAAPLIDRQRQDVSTLLQFGGDVATSQANIETGQQANISDLITDIGAVTAAGEVSAGNIASRADQNLLTAGLTLGGLALI